MARVPLSVIRTLLAVTLTLTLPGMAWADEEADREAAMFGEPEPGADAAPAIAPPPSPAAPSPPAPPSPPPPPGSESDREAAMFGGDDSTVPTWNESETERRLLDRLRETQDTLAIGGRLHLQYVAKREKSDAPAPFDGGDDTAAPGLLDIYFDARPSGRVRSYTRIRLKHYAIADRTDWLLDQLWLKFDVASAVYVTLGRQHIKWGISRIWNPTDFLMDARDPLAVIDERTGRNFLKLHVPWESMGWNLYAVGEVVSDGEEEHAGGVGRAEILLGPAEFALTGYKRQEGPWRVGGDLSAGVGPLDLRAEAAWDDDTKKARIVGGVEAPFNYSDEDSATIGFEYLENPLSEPFNPLYRGERYVAASLALLAPGSWNDTMIIANAIHNLQHKDWIARLDWRVRVLTYLNVSVYVSHAEFFDFEVSLGEVTVKFDANRTEAGVGFTLNL